MGTVTIGMDAGHKHDPTAICVAEMDVRPTGSTRHDPRWHASPATVQCGPECRADTAVHFVARFLQRLPLGTSYPDVAERLHQIVSALRVRGIERIELRVDSTGVGPPWWTLCARRCARNRVRLWR